MRHRAKKWLTILLPLASCRFANSQQAADEFGGGELIRPGKEEWWRNWKSVVVVAVAWGWWLLKLDAQCIGFAKKCNEAQEKTLVLIVC